MRHNFDSRFIIKSSLHYYYQSIDFQLLLPFTFRMSMCDMCKMCAAPFHRTFFDLIFVVIFFRHCLFKRATTTKKELFESHENL